MTHEFWVDLESGTYGEAGNIRFIRFGEDQQVLVDAFVEGSDNYRIAAAKAWGEDYLA